MKLYTFSDIKALDPCYLRDGREPLLRRLIGEGLTAAQIASAEVPWRDRIWVLVRLMPPEKRPFFAADVAESVLYLVREQDRAVCREAIDAARSGDRQRAAAAAARAATYAAAYADAAAYAAARAARAAAYAADAAYARAARAAAYAADAAADAYAADAAANANAAEGEEFVRIAAGYCL